MNSPSYRNGAMKVIIPEYAKGQKLSKVKVFEISNRNSIGPSYMQYSISNKSSWAHVFNSPIIMPTDVSRHARIGRQLHPLKAKHLMKDKVIEID